MALTSLAVAGTKTVVTACSAMALNLELNTGRYLPLLENLIGETKFLQNSPPHYTPEEDR